MRVGLKAVKMAGWTVESSVDQTAGSMVDCWVDSTDG
jgi:hypothetical protein